MRHDLCDLLLVPRGGIGPCQMIRGGLFLIGLGTLLHAARFLVPSLGISASAEVVGLFLIVPWCFLWMKRLRDRKWLPVLAVVPILLYGVFYSVLSVFGLFDILAASIEQSYEQYPEDPVQMQTATIAMFETAMTEQPKRFAATTMIAHIITSMVILFIGNGLIKSKAN